MKLINSTKYACEGREEINARKKEKEVVYLHSTGLFNLSSSFWWSTRCSWRKQCKHITPSVCVLAKGIRPVRSCVPVELIQKSTDTTWLTDPSWQIRTNVNRLFWIHTLTLVHRHMAQWHVSWRCSQNHCSADFPSFLLTTLLHTSSALSYTYTDTSNRKS